MSVPLVIKLTKEARNLEGRAITTLFGASAPGRCPDPMDAADDHRQNDVNSILAAALRGQGTQFERAAQRADQGLYDICEDCGGQIPEERHQVVPSATACVGCQRLREERRKRF